MRYSKLALLTFGAGLVLGLIVVVAELDALDRVASALMALGVIAIPVGLVFDWRSAAKRTRPRPRKRAKPTPRRRKPPSQVRAASPPRRPVPPKR